MDNPKRPPYALRPSRVLRVIREGGVASCYKLNLSDPRAAEIAAGAGFDAIWICNEHVPSDWLALENQIRAAKLYDCDTVVRVGRGSYSDYVRAFEMDAAGLMVPHIMSLADAQAVVRTTRFGPVGRRPIDGGNADGGFTRVPLADYLKDSNAERFVIFQIEDPEPLAELEAIAELPGVDMLFFGPGDFTHAIGRPGAFKDPEVVAVKKRVAEVARKAGKAAGTVSNPAAFADDIAMGYNFLNGGSDVGALVQRTDQVIEAFAAAMK